MLRPERRPLLLLHLLFLLLPFFPAADVAASSRKVVTFKTADRMTITADLWEAGMKGAPAVVAIHGHERSRAHWRRNFAARCVKAGITFLSLDLRGYGDSRMQGRKDLRAKVHADDPNTFRSMWKDVAAAYEFLVERGVDPGRVAFLGVQAGAAVAIDAAAREPRIIGAVFLTPKDMVPGIDTKKHLKDYGSRPTRMFATEKDFHIGARTIAESVGRAAEVTKIKEKFAPGDELFGKVPDLEKTIADWFADQLGAGVYLDGRVTDTEEPRIIFGEWDMMENGKGRPALSVAGRWLYAGIRMKDAAAGPEVFHVAWARDGDPARARRIACEFGAKGATFRFEALSGNRWKEVRGALPKGVRLGVSTPNAVEIRIPRHLDGLTTKGDLKVALAVALKKGNHLSALPLGDNNLTDVRKWMEYGLPD